jgi:hypothetical protein
MIETRHLFTLTLSTAKPDYVGKTPAVDRRVIQVTGGTFVGERLRGTVLPNADWQTLGADGLVQLDVRAVLHADDGALIAYQYRGIRAAPPEVLARIDRGEEVDPSLYYFRSVGGFETAVPAYTWLNRVLAVATGNRTPKGPVYDVFEVL